MNVQLLILIQLLFKTIVTLELQNLILVHTNRCSKLIRVRCKVTCLARSFSSKSFFCFAKFVCEKYKLQLRERTCTRSITKCEILLGIIHCKKYSQHMHFVE